MSCPHPSELALALSIVKSKPPHTSIKDYILDVRRHIHVGQRNIVDATEDRYLDSAAFWREAYEKSEAYQSRLLDKVYELEQRTEAVAFKARADVEHGAMSSKRKAICGVFTTEPLSSKRSKTAGAAISSNDKLSYSEASNPVKSSTTPFLRRLHRLQKLLQKKTESEQLAIASADLCVAMEQLIDTTISQRQAKSKKEKGCPLQQNLTLRDISIVFEQCYPIIFRALQRLAGREDGACAYGIIVYRLVHLFQSILLHLHRHTLLRAKLLISRAKSVSKKARQTAKAKRENTIESLSPQLSREDSRLLDTVSQLLVKMILQITTGKNDHSDLLEGFLFVLLEHVGKVLGSLVFKGLKSDTSLAVCPTRLPIPCPGFQDTENGTNVSILECAAMLQSRHLICILEHALSIQCQGDSASGFVGAHSSLLVRGRKRKLQNTLLKGVFGHDDPTLQESLKSSREINPSLPTGYSDNDLDSPGCDKGDWFVQEVWRLLGWDSLVQNQSDEQRSSPEA
ncbi:hypothetical protein LOZ36_002441 [Ophidiomyces ophidiicola]|nr:hypothetical protein LOZ43_001890 [Ophidiomyces ophidiicola]KAI2088118.1 hypothetical protein LOZ36_002441 [Ophidiomyces ophidiicola]